MDSVHAISENIQNFNLMDVINSWATTIVGTALGFLLAMYASRKLEKSSDRKKLLEEKKDKFSQLQFLNGVLGSLISYLSIQSKSYLEFSENVRNDPYEIVLPETPASFDLLRLRNLHGAAFREAYSTFFSKNESWLDDYQNLFAHGDYALRLVDGYQDQISKAIDFKHRDQLATRDLLEEISTSLAIRIRKLIDELGEPIAMKSDEAMFCDSLLISYARFTKSFLDFQDAKETFFIPLRRDALSLISDRALGEKLFFLSNQALNRLTNIEQNSLSLAQEMEEFSKKIGSSLTYFETQQSVLDNLDTQIQLHLNK